MLAGRAIWQFSHPSRLNLKDPLHSCCLWELGRDHLRLTLFYMMKNLIRLFYSGVENVLYCYKNKPTGIIQWHKRDTAGHYLFFFIFFKSKAVGCL